MRITEYAKLVLARLRYSQRTCAGDKVTRALLLPGRPGFIPALIPASGHGYRLSMSRSQSHVIAEHPLGHSSQRPDGH